MSKRGENTTIRGTEGEVIVIPTTKTQWTEFLFQLCLSEMKELEEELNVAFDDGGSCQRWTLKDQLISCVERKFTIEETIQIFHNRGPYKRCHSFADQLLKFLQRITSSLPVIEPPKNDVPDSVAIPKSIESETEKEKKKKEKRIESNQMSYVFDVPLTQESVSQISVEDRKTLNTIADEIWNALTFSFPKSAAPFSIETLFAACCYHHVTVKRLRHAFRYSIQFGKAVSRHKKFWDVASNIDEIALKSMKRDVEITKTVLVPALPIIEPLKNDAPDSIATLKSTEIETNPETHWTEFLFEIFLSDLCDHTPNLNIDINPEGVRYGVKSWTLKDELQMCMNRHFTIQKTIEIFQRRPYHNACNWLAIRLEKFLQRVVTEKISALSIVEPSKNDAPDAVAIPKSIENEPDHETEKEKEERNVLQKSYIRNAYLIGGEKDYLVIVRGGDDSKAPNKVRELPESSRKYLNDLYVQMATELNAPAASTLEHANKTIERFHDFYLNILPLFINLEQDHKIEVMKQEQILQCELEKQNKLIADMRDDRVTVEEKFKQELERRNNMENQMQTEIQRSNRVRAELARNYVALEKEKTNQERNAHTEKCVAKELRTELEELRQRYAELHNIRTDDDGKKQMQTEIEELKKKCNEWKTSNASLDTEMKSMQKRVRLEDERLAHQVKLLKQLDVDRSRIEAIAWLEKKIEEERDQKISVMARHVDAQNRIDVLENTLQREQDKFDKSKYTIDEMKSKIEQLERRIRTILDARSLETIEHEKQVDALRKMLTHTSPQFQQQIRERQQEQRDQIASRFELYCPYCQKDCIVRPLVSIDKYDDESMIHIITCQPQDPELKHFECNWFANAKELCRFENNHRNTWFSKPKDADDNAEKRRCYFVQNWIIVDQETIIAAAAVAAITDDEK